MKKIIFSLFLLLFSVYAVAQTSFEGKKDIVTLRGNETVSMMPGQTLLLLPQQDKKEEFTPLKANWKPEVEYVQVPSLFGGVLKVPYVTHIPSFFVYANVLDDKSIVVTEKISLILTQQQRVPFSRSYENVLNDVQGNKVVQNVNFLWAKYNGTQILPVIKQEETKTVFSFFEGDVLPSGVHLFELSYILPNAIQINGNTSYLFFSSLGSELSYLTERFQIFLAYPSDTSFVQADILFGQNNQKVEDAADIFIDDKSHLMFNVKGILPAFADVRLKVIADAKGFVNLPFSEKLDDGLFYNNGFIVVILISILLFLYFRFSALDLIDRRIESSYLSEIRSRLNFDIGLLRYLLVKKIDEKTLLSYVLYLVGKKEVNIHVTPKMNIDLIKGKNISKADKSLIRCLMPFGAKRCQVSKISRKKTVRFIHRLLRWQVLKIIRRELCIGAIFVLMGCLFLQYSQLTDYKKMVGIVVILLAYFLSVVYFLSKGHFVSFLHRLFWDYAKIPVRADRKKVLEIALDKENERGNELILSYGKNKEISVSEFEKLFLMQIEKGKK